VDAAFMLFELHERGIHVVSRGGLAGRWAVGMGLAGRQVVPGQVGRD
jgi:hypothetical protein